MSNYSKDNSKDDLKNYDLNSEAVDTLANADKEEIPQYSEEELRKYRKKKFQFPDWLKVSFIKFWFAGAVCYFMVLGTSLASWNFLDIGFVLGIVLGMVTDLLTNNVLRFIAPYDGAYDKWLLVTKRGVVGFMLNILVHFVLIAAVMFIYLILNTYFALNIYVEPLLFGLLCMGIELLFVGIKHLCSSILNDAKAAALGDSKSANQE